MDIGIVKSAVIGALLVAIGCSTRLASSTDSAASISHAASTTQKSPGAGVISPENTTIRFVGSALLISHEGTFTRFTGKLECPNSNLALARVWAQVEMDSVYTEIPLLTKHLKAADFFDTAKFPLATFVTRRIDASPSTGDTHLVTGEFTIHGQSKTITFPATLDIQPTTLHFKAAFTIRQSDFGMNASRTTADDVPVTVDATVRRE